MTDDNPQYIVQASRLSKAYDSSRVVDDVSFTVTPGEIFGLIGPNGAGKTTIIRMLMDIVKPDSGDITIMGKSMDEKAKDKIGYLPEERGLYRKPTVFQTLVYLAALKNTSPEVARKRIEDLLTQTNMKPNQNKKIEELSKGMSQLIQLLATIIHQPQLVILDEPFGGLDPVNTKLIKELILELRDQGKGIILSTHMMNEVEEMCDRILMINKGCTMLYGELTEIKSRYKNNSLLVESSGSLDNLEGVSGRKDYGQYIELFLDKESTPQMILEQLIRRDIEINRFEVSTPSLTEIFIRIVEQGQ